jgi:hypothetical protein
MSLILDGTNGVSDIDGTAATPAIRGTDTNTGIFFPAADTIAFSEGGVEAMRINSAGNVGIGTTTPSGKLSVVGTIGLINTVTPANNSSISDLGGLSLQSLNSNPMYFNTGGAERMRITSSGALLVGKTAVNAVVNGFEVLANGLVYSTMTTANSSTYHMYNTSTALYAFYVLANGGIANYSGNNANLSDERTKKNIEEAGSYLDKICSIPVKLFNYNEEVEGEQKTLGVIAQDVEAVAPEFVNNDGWKGSEPKDGVPLKTVYSTDLMFGMMKAIQELKTIVDKQSTELDSVKAELATLKAKS